MENQKPNHPPRPYPWYDDRVTVPYEEEEPADAKWPYNMFPPRDAYDSPKKIYGYLDGHVWKQDAAKKAASIIAYNCFVRAVKSNAMFVGPTGCGKTHIWRCLKEIFPDRIEIVDGSNLTQDGWKGEKKWGSLLSSPAFRSDRHSILVIDEADKMLSPRYTSGGENTSHSIQSEGLAMMEGTHIAVKEGSASYRINTARVSFVFCGAFSAKAADIAGKESGSRIGFGAAPDKAQAYSRPMTEADLMDFGVMPEFMGRIQRIVNLEPMTADDYYRMTDSSCAPMQRLWRQYRAEVRLTGQTRHELAEEAARSGLGVRGMENRIRDMLDEALFEDCSQRRFEL